MSEYITTDWFLNMSQAVLNARSRYRLMSTSREMGIFRAKSQI